MGNRNSIPSLIRAVSGTLYFGPGSDFNLANGGGIAAYGLTVTSGGIVGVGGVTSPQGAFQVGNNLGGTGLYMDNTSYLERASKAWITYTATDVNQGTMAGGAGLTIHNNSTTDGNWSTLAFSGYEGEGGKNVTAAAIRARITNRTVSSGVNGDLAFFTSPKLGLLERMRIDTNGNVAIGTTTSYSKLSVWGNSTTVGRALEVADSASSTLFAINNSGNISVATSTGYSKFSVWGNSTTVGRAFEVTDSASTTLFAIDNSGTTTIDYLTTGAMSFEADSGMLQWVDMPVSTTTAGLAMGYSATIDGSEMITTFASTSGTGGTTGYKVIIGTTSPQILGSNNGATTGLIVSNGYLCVDKNGTCSGANAAGVIYATDGTVANTADVAEDYPTNEPLESGDIVMLDKTNALHVKKSSENKYVFGIVSTKPGLLLGAGNPYNASSTASIALSGRVPTKVNLENGPISVGDYIAVSSVAGVGMKATTSGQVVGIALEPFDGNSVGENGQAVYEQTGNIEVFVNLGYQRLSDAIENGTVASGWIADQTTGYMKLASSTSLDMQGENIVNIGKMISKSGKWSIDENGNLAVQGLKVGLPENPTGITLYDKTTGAPYCFFIEGGMAKTMSGECVAGVPATPVPASEPSSSPQTTPQTAAVADTSTSTTTATSTSSVTVPVVEAATTTPDVVPIEPAPVIPPTETATTTP